MKRNWRRVGRVAAVALSFAVLVVAVVWYRGGSGAEPSARPQGRPPVPVSIAIATRQNVPIYLTGLGTVQAVLTVGIHSQVDGKLQEVLFTEGQHVHKDDVLARIDPRLFQHALDQAKARKAQDEALLVAAQKDLTAIGGALGTGVRDLGRDVNRLVHDARRDLDKMRRSMQGELHRLQKDLTTIVTTRRPEH